MHPVDLLYNTIMSSPSWMESAACKGKDPFSEDISPLCDTCPVRDECEKWADGMENRFSAIAGRKPGE